MKELYKILWQEAFKDLQQFYLELAKNHHSNTINYSSFTKSERKQYWSLKRNELLARSDYKRIM